MVNRSLPFLAGFRRDSLEDKVFTIVNNLFLVTVLVLVAYPLTYIVSSSFSSPEAVIKGRVKLFPVEPSVVGYREVFLYPKVWIGYTNSLFYMVVGTTLNVFMTILAAYPLSRPDFYGRRVVIAVFTFTMFFSGGLIPSYLLVRSLGMLNRRAALIIPGALAVYNVIITRTFFMNTIPESLLEAAHMDGCGDFRFVRSIVLPLSGAIVAVNALFYAVGHWNQYFGALIYLRDEKLYPLQIYLRSILILNSMEETMQDLDMMEEKLRIQQLLKYSLIVVASVPVLAIYPFVQRYFVKGIMIGSLKG